MRTQLLCVIGAGFLGCSGAAFSASLDVMDTAFGDVEKGREFYEQRCIVCHGVDGRGKNGIAPDFSREWQRLTKTDAQLAANIRNEYRSSDRHYVAASCPPHSITDDEMEDLMAYLRQLSESIRSTDAFGLEPTVPSGWPEELNQPGGFEPPGGVEPPPFGMDRP